MSKKNFILLGASFLAVAAFYFYLYKDSFRKPHIQISHTIRASAWALAHSQNSGDEPLRTVIFGLERDYRLTSVKVLQVSELETNKYAHPIWELTSDSNSVPTRAFTYGMRIRGMHPPIKGERPGQLDLNVPYRLVIEAGKINGAHDFTLSEDNHVTP
jgi:hypothetical protein